jgi:hypothetical protein
VLALQLVVLAAVPQQRWLPPLCARSYPTGLGSRPASAGLRAGGVPGGLTCTATVAVCLCRAPTPIGAKRDKVKKEKRGFGSFD